MGIAKKPEQNRGSHPGRAEMAKELETGEKSKRLTVDLPPEVYRRLRLYAAEQDTTISEIVRGQLHELLGGQ